MNKTAIMMAFALVATAAVAAAPTATADTIVDCAVREGHPPEHCAEDCLPLHGNPLTSPNRPWDCHEHE